MEPLGAPGNARLTSWQNSAPRGRLVEGGVREAPELDGSQLTLLGCRSMVLRINGMSCWYLGSMSMDLFVSPYLSGFDSSPKLAK